MSRRPLDEATLRKRLEALPLWKVEAGALCRTFHLAGFSGSIDFVLGVAQAAERMNHHPDIDIRWNRVTLRWVTHDAGGITESDLALAAQCDALAPAPAP